MIGQPMTCKVREGAVMHLDVSAPAGYIKCHKCTASEGIPVFHDPPECPATLVEMIDRHRGEFFERPSTDRDVRKWAHHNYIVIEVENTTAKGRIKAVSVYGFVSDTGDFERIGEAPNWQCAREWVKAMPIYDPRYSKESRGGWGWNEARQQFIACFHSCTCAHDPTARVSGHPPYLV